MYAQLGNIIFKGLYGFSDLLFDGEESNYAEFELINRKPALQYTGTSLLEISANITMNVAFCNITSQLQALKKYKEDGEVLPLLMGNGTYVGDFVIVAVPFSVDDAFSDGTYKSISLKLSLKEYISINKLEQLQVSARKKAFAVGDKKPIILRSPQPISNVKSIAETITATKQSSEKVNSITTEMQTNPNSINADKLLNAAKKGKNDVQTVIDKLTANAEVLANNPSIKTAAEVVLSSFNDVVSNYPFDDIAKTAGANNLLQANTRTFSRSSTSLLQQVIVRK